MKHQILFSRKKSEKYLKKVICLMFYPACKVLKNVVEIRTWTIGSASNHYTHLHSWRNKDIYFFKGGKKEKFIQIGYISWAVSLLY